MQNAVDLYLADMKLLDLVPSETNIHTIEHVGYEPPRYLILVDGKPAKLATTRLSARIVARVVGFRNLGSLIEVEHRPTGERAPVDLSGSFDLGSWDDGRDDA